MFQKISTKIMHLFILCTVLWMMSCGQSANLDQEENTAQPSSEMTSSENEGMTFMDGSAMMESGELSAQSQNKITFVKPTYGTKVILSKQNGSQVFLRAELFAKKYEPIPTGWLYEPVPTGWRSQPIPTGWLTEPVPTGWIYARVRTGEVYQPVPTGWKYEPIPTGWRSEPVPTGWRYEMEWKFLEDAVSENRLSKRRNWPYQKTTLAIDEKAFSVREAGTYTLNLRVFLRSHEGAEFMCYEEQHRIV